MNNYFGVFYVGDSYEAVRLLEEARAQSLNALGIDRRELVSRIDESVHYFWKEKELPKISWAVMRPGKFGVDKNQLKMQMPVFMQWLVLRGVKVLDAATSATAFVVNNKWNQLVLLSEAGIPVVKTEVFGLNNLIPEDFFSQPRIIKRVDGAVGNAVWKTSSQENALEIIEREKLGNLIFEPYCPGGIDYRVLVLGKRVLGAMKRTAPIGDFRSNFSVGGSVEQVEVSQEMSEIAINAAQTLQLDYAGIDLIPVNGKLRVLEVNRSAQFQGFEKATGINVAKQIVQFLINEK